VENIRVAGLLHDIGKIEVSGEVLRKAAELNEEERESMNEHAAKGARLLASVGNVLKEVVPIVLSHHKNAMGRPESKEDSFPADIPLGARIVAVADAFGCDDFGSALPERNASLAGLRRNCEKHRKAI
jgi:putative nucleotidyltransferase with HDIG domain